MLNDRKIALLRDDLDRLNLSMIPFAADFYDLLFERDARVRGLFPDDMISQTAKLSSALGATIHGLQYPETLEARLAELGARHAGYGAREDDFELVIATMVDTLEAWLGPAWDDERRTAWIEALEEMAQYMKAGIRAAA